MTHDSEWTSLLETVCSYPFHLSPLTSVLQGVLIHDDLTQEGRIEAFLSENYAFDSRNGKYLITVAIPGSFPMSFLRCYILTK